MRCVSSTFPLLLYDILAGVFFLIIHFPTDCTLPRLVCPNTSSLSRSCVGVLADPFKPPKINFTTRM